MESLIKKINKCVSPGNVLLDVDMGKYTSFKVGGKARALVIAKNIEELKRLLVLLNDEKEEYLILGNGTNTLFKDSGYRGIIVKLGSGFEQIRIVPQSEMNELIGSKIDKASTYIEVGSNMLLSSVGSFALQESLSGFEFASGIPGSVGGGIFMNAGAYDGELKDILVGVKLLSKDGTEEKFVPVEKLKLAYRHSILQETKDIVCSAFFKLNKDSKEKIKDKMDDLTSRRNSKQPVQYPSCGSFFKRPEGYFAGKLIQDAGLKGCSFGGAKVSEKHSGFIINTGGATATDIIKLMEKVQSEVREKFGVELKPEVRIIGD